MIVNNERDKDLADPSRIEITIDPKSGPLRHK